MVMADCGVMSHGLPVLHVLNLVITDISVGLDFYRRLGSQYTAEDAGGAISA